MLTIFLYVSVDVFNQEKLIVVMVLFIAIVLVTLVALSWTKKKKMIPEKATNEEGNFQSVHILNTLTFFTF